MRPILPVLLLAALVLAGCADQPAATHDCVAEGACPSTTPAPEGEDAPAPTTDAAAPSGATTPSPSDPADPPASTPPPTATPQPTSSPTPASPAPEPQDKGGSGSGEGGSQPGQPQDEGPILFEGKYSRQAGGYIDTYEFYLDGTFQLESWNFVSGNTYYNGLYDLRQGVLQLDNGEVRSLAAYADFSSVFVDGDQYYRG